MVGFYGVGLWVSSVGLGSSGFRVAVRHLLSKVSGFGLWGLRIRVYLLWL